MAGRQAVPNTALGEERLHARARAFLRASKAPSTLRAYRSDWQHFSAWCAGRTISSLPAAPETVALYLVALAETHRPATLTRRQTSIAKAHAAAGHPNPATTQHAVVAETLQGIRRTLGTAQPGKTPLLTADLIQVLAHLPAGLAGVRDRALLLVGYTGGLRRSELAAFTMDDLSWVPEGAVLTLRRSKTDQAGQGRKVAIPRGAHAATCPVTALRQWLEAAGIVSGMGRWASGGSIGIRSEPSSSGPWPGRDSTRKDWLRRGCNASRTQLMPCTSCTDLSIAIFAYQQLVSGQMYVSLSSHSVSGCS